MAVEPFQPISARIQAQVDEVSERAYRAVVDELTAIGHDIHSAAVREAPPTSPEDDPDPRITLKDQGRVIPATAAHPRTIVIFEAPYATVQHEMDYKHPRGGKPKYLEDPLKRAIPTLEARIAGAVRRAID